MKVIIDLKDFEGWSSVPKRLQEIKDARKFEALEEYLEEMYGDTIEAVKLNDLIQMDYDDLKQQLGMNEVDESMLNPFVESLVNILDKAEE